MQKTYCDSQRAASSFATPKERTESMALSDTFPHRSRPPRHCMVSRGPRPRGARVALRGHPATFSYSFRNEFAAVLSRARLHRDLSQVLEDLAHALVAAVGLLLEAAQDDGLQLRRQLGVERP